VAEKKVRFTIEFQGNPSMMVYRRGGGDIWEEARTDASFKLKDRVRDARAEGNLDLAKELQILRDRLEAVDEAKALEKTEGGKDGMFHAHFNEPPPGYPTTHQVFAIRDPGNKDFWEAFSKLDVSDRRPCLQQLWRAAPPLNADDQDRSMRVLETTAYDALFWAWDQPGWTFDPAPLTVKRVFTPPK
jgi:hypothetical protein